MMTNILTPADITTASTTTPYVNNIRAYQRPTTTKQFNPPNPCWLL